MQINAENNNLYGPIADGAFAVCIILLTKPAISLNSVKIGTNLNPIKWKWESKVYYSHRANSFPG